MDPRFRPFLPRPVGLSAAVLAVLALAMALAACALPAPGATSAPAAPASPAGGLAPRGATEPARVIRVVDGDTILVDRGDGPERVRYIGIDAPESVREDTPIEFMGSEASAANAALVEDREVVLERDVSERDQYGRLLRHVWLRAGDGWTFVNFELVRRGFANAVTYQPDVRWTEELRAAERAARAEAAGLWGPATPLP